MTRLEPKRVTLTDVTLREYGQNVRRDDLHVFTPRSRVAIALGLADAGFRDMEVLSCVHPAVAPAMEKDALKTIAAGLSALKGVHIITLVPNRAGFRNFLACGLGPDGCNHTLGMFFSVVEAHNRANLGRTIGETLAEYRDIAREARAAGIRMTGYLSAALGFREPGGTLIRPAVTTVNEYAEILFGFGVRTVTLSDLQGVADPQETKRFFETLLNLRKGEDTRRLGFHPHHVSGQAAVDNSAAAYAAGIRRFDASLGGTGGCVTGAPGNQPTEGLVRRFHAAGIETGVDEKKVRDLSAAVRRIWYDRIPAG